LLSASKLKKHCSWVWNQKAFRTTRDAF